ncbi:MAG: DUF5684 domain-containing protein [Flavobacteriaceae bacterium]|jgi:hypothetical protein|nr:DUF5684 domain-containing protein [Flavobacteriaceae bacterium]
MGGVILSLIYLAIVVATVVSLWKLYEKAGQEGWKSIIPIYGIYVLVVDIVKRPVLWVILSLFIPIAFIVIAIDLAVKFGKSKGFGIGIFFLPFIFIPLLAFSDAKYDETAKNDVLDSLGDIGKQEA